MIQNRRHHLLTQHRQTRPSQGQHRNQRARRSRLMRCLMMLLLLFCFTAIGLLAVLYSLERTPREIAPYIEHRVSGHRPLLVKLGHDFADYLQQQDRMILQAQTLPALTLGAQQIAPSSSSSNSRRPRQILIADIDQLRLALRTAQAGDDILLAPGHYVLNSQSLSLNRPGTAEAPITLRAAQLGAVKIDSLITEAIVVSAPYWRVENLEVQGVCQTQEFCEHAFHVIGGAHHFLAQHNRLIDFNAHIKINGARGQQPDDGVLVFNTISNTQPRVTARAVTPIDLVAASGWQIRKNIISDFIKAGGDRISYGVFAKGGGANNLIEQNLVLCEHHMQQQAGQRVGISLGGGGTGAAYCRDQRCIVEQAHSVIRANLIMACSDDGIYLNKAADSLVSNNTLIDTSGVTVRFAQSAARLEGNLVDGLIRSRDDGLIHATDNQSSPLWGLFVGYHPVRHLFRDVTQFDLNWMDTSKPADSALDGDLCSQVALVEHANLHPRASIIQGAFQQFSDCLARP